MPKKVTEFRLKIWDKLIIFRFKDKNILSVRSSWSSAIPATPELSESWSWSAFRTSDWFSCGFGFSLMDKGDGWYILFWLGQNSYDKEKRKDYVYNYS